MLAESSNTDIVLRSMRYKRMNIPGAILRYLLQNRQVFVGDCGDESYCSFRRLGKFCCVRPPSNNQIWTNWKLLRTFTVFMTTPKHCKLGKQMFKYQRLLRRYSYFFNNFYTRILNASHLEQSPHHPTLPLTSTAT